MYRPGDVRALARRPRAWPSPSALAAAQRAAWIAAVRLWLGAREAAVSRHGCRRARPVHGARAVGTDASGAGIVPQLTLIGGTPLRDRRAAFSYRPGCRRRIARAPVRAASPGVRVDARCRDGRSARPRGAARAGAIETTVPPDVRVELVRALPATVTRVVGVGDLVLRSFRSLAVADHRCRWRDARRTPSCCWSCRRGTRSGSRRRCGGKRGHWSSWTTSIRGASRRLVRSRAGWRPGWRRAPKGGACARWTDVFAVSDAIITDVRQLVSRGLVRCPRVQRRTGSRSADRTLLLAAHERAVSGVAGRWPGRSRPRGRRPVGRLVYIGALSDAQLPVLAVITRCRRAAPRERSRRRPRVSGSSSTEPPMRRPRVAVRGRRRSSPSGGLESQVSEHPVRVPYVRALTLADGADANLVLGDTTVVLRGVETHAGAGGAAARARGMCTPRPSPPRYCAASAAAA